MNKLDYCGDICSLAAYIENNIKSNTDYSKLGKEIGFSYRHLRDFFGKRTGISLSRYISARKIANAAFDIRHSGKSITEIAFEYEFSNLDTFTRAFRRNTGLTPSEFRKSNYLCGRRIICPGVYAPIILNLDNPNFTLLNLKEVNIMGEMAKTADSCVLYGVPKIHWMRQDGDFPQFSQGTPFPMCLQSVLNYMGQNISYAQIMAYSGAAFRLRWGVKDGGWNLGAVDIRNIYSEPLKPFELAFKAAGRSFEILYEKEKSKIKKPYLNLIKTEIDCGRPLIALGVVGPPEACIITGYRNNGETLLGWSFFQGDCEFSSEHSIDESGYFIKDNWWENIEGIMSIGEDIGDSTPLKEILENTLTVLTKDEINACCDDHTYCGDYAFYGGQSAYEAWAKAIETDDYFSENVDISWRGYCQNDAATMIAEGRSFAWGYLCKLKEENSSLADKFKECAEFIGESAKCGGKMQEVRGGWEVNHETMQNFRKQETRLKIAELIRRAAEYEKKACVVLRGIIETLG